MMSESWYYRSKEGEHGPYSSADLRTLVTRGVINDDTVIRYQDKVAKAKDVPGLLVANDPPQANEPKNREQPKLEKAAAAPEVTNRKSGLLFGLGICAWFFGVVAAANVDTSNAGRRAIGSAPIDSEWPGRWWWVGVLCLLASVIVYRGRDGRM